MRVYAIIETGPHLGESPRLVELTVSASRADEVKRKTLIAAAANQGFEKSALSICSNACLGVVCIRYGIEVSIRQSYLES